MALRTNIRTRESERETEITTVAFPQLERFE